MNERLAFGVGAYGRSDAPSRAAGRRAGVPDPAPDSVTAEPGAAPADRRDWAFTGLMAFTALLFLRPQDHIPLLAMVPLAEIAAIIGLLSLVTSRLGRGLAISRLTPELAGVVAVGLVILATAPFSIWMGGAVGTFTGMYVKVILIFVLMVNTLDSPRRIDRFMWLIVLASTYIAGRAVFDYARGVNLIEYGRVQGALGGIFRNPNDLALNMVAVLPIAGLLAIRAATVPRRLFTVGCGLVMIAAIIASHSRSGTVGLAAMMLLVAVFMVRRRPGLVFAGGIALLLAVPLAPDAYWSRIASITDETKDDTGSREARSVLLRESWQAFLAHPLTGVGAGQFKNYKPEGRVEAWRESHNVILQVAADLGLFGLMAFTFLLARAALVGRQTRQLLRRVSGTGKGARGARAPGAGPVITADEVRRIEAHTIAMSASLAGWFVCALFASVAYNWTFYYMLAIAAAPREMLLDRLAAAVPRRARFGRPVVVQEARA
jgi:O-antigen ligase